MQKAEALKEIAPDKVAIDTTSQNGRMFFYMLTSYAEGERATIRERTSSRRLK